MKKICPYCKQLLSLNCFGKNRHKKDGLNAKCKKCVRQYYHDNRERILKYYQKNKEEILEKCKQYYQNNKEKIAKQGRKYRQNNKEKRNERNRRNRKNPIFKLNHNVGKAIYKSLKTQSFLKNGRHWESLVNFTLRELVTHLENLFQDGMTWRNHGKWHIDHIKPISLFNFESVNDSEFKECWSLSNLQPLWAEDNHSKGNKFKEV